MHPSEEVVPRVRSEIEVRRDWAKGLYFLTITTWCGDEIAGSASIILPDTMYVASEVEVIADGVRRSLESPVDI